MSLYVRAANPIWYLPDLVGNPLNDQYYAFFLGNVFPYLSQPVYSTPNGTVWNNPLEFSPAGTLPNNLYFDPTLTYRIEVRRGNTQADPLIWLIENYDPDQGAATSTVYPQVLSNQIINSQFKLISFISPLVITTEGTYDIAPGWQLILTGPGSNATVTQIINSVTNPQINDPTYAIEISTTGWTTANLVQTFDGNAALWASTADQGDSPAQYGVVSMSITAVAITNPYLLTLQYLNGLTPSPPLSPTTFPSKTIAIGSYQVLDGNIIVPVPASGSSTSTSFTIQLQGTGDIRLSNAQIVAQSVSSDNISLSDLETSLLDNNLVYQQQTPEQQINGLFNYYNEPLQYKQIPSYLVGWDFPLNPAQILGPTVAASAIGANKSKYVWDQTIIFQSVNSSIGVARGPGGNIAIQAAIAGQMAMIQYLDAIQLRKLLCQDICVNLCGLASPSNISGTISLWYTNDVSLPSMASNNSLVATLDANGKPAMFNGNWSEIPRSNANNQDATFTATGAVADGTEWNNYPFSGWALNDNSIANGATYFAIVIGTATIPLNDVFNIESVSLQAGNIPTRPAPQTEDEVLRECQYYYEKSYNISVVPGTVTNVGAIITTATMNTASTVPNLLYLASFYLQFKQQKYAIPTLTFYAPDGTASAIKCGVLRNGAYPAASGGSANPNPTNFAASNWGATFNAQGGCTLICGATTTLQITVGATAGDEGTQIYHYTADARLGV